MVLFCLDNKRLVNINYYKMKTSGFLEKGTIYSISVMGIKKVEARNIEWSIEEFAQYANGIILKFKPKRKQLIRVLKSSDSEIVIFKDWNHKAPISFGKTIHVDGGVISSFTRVMLSKESFIENRNTFNNFIDEYLKDNKSKLIIDFRQHVIKTRF